MYHRIRLPFVLLLLLLLAPAARADEGMWMPGNLNKATRKAMKEMGLRLSPKQIYNTRQPSLKDAVVNFGGFCSGVVVSHDGLMLTNHHCGFGSIQQHSSVQHNYLQDGFTAYTRDEELPNPELYVRFLLETKEVTRRVLGAVTPGMNEQRRTEVVDSVSRLIEHEAILADTTLVAVVDAFYGGNEFWLSVYQDYDDVRLVYAPPSSVGKFGWDTDNWVWPRHTGDFSIFRIYADRNNRPAPYSPDNVPYHPKYVAPISTQGYSEGDFCMTMGYPGSTERYLSSFGIEEMMNGNNQAQIDIRGVKEGIWKKAMNANDSIRIKYASKYDESSNYRKNSIGVNRSIAKQHILEKKRLLEQTLLRWINNTPTERASLLHLFNDLELAYKARREANRAQAYFIEAFLNAAELPQLALRVLNFDSGGEPKAVEASKRSILEQYADMDVQLDKQVFATMLREYRAKVSDAYLPDFYHTIDSRHAGNIQAFTDSIYANTQLATPEGFYRMLTGDASYNVADDPATSVCLDLLTTMFEMNGRLQPPTEKVEQGERLFNAAVRRMYAARNFYPDANMTMRMSLGNVAGYTPYDGAHYDYFTTPKGILEKARSHSSDSDYAVQPALLKLLASDEARNLHVCFITNNDITGGNSGSPMFNNRCELLVLAFDGNWEAMRSDIMYDPARQRCIGVDVRYMLFIMEKYGKAEHLIRELSLSRR
ncbi:MAG: S46 family peptidase [Mediterranea sp.]|nr:S46 family peptidase [Mediterranea sp.]